MYQTRLELAFGMIEGPKAVKKDLVYSCGSFREACRLAWQLKRIRNMSFKLLAERGSFTYQHVSDWFNADDKPTRRSMPAEHIANFEAIVGNTLVSQWVAARSNLTVLEEFQAERNAA